MIPDDELPDPAVRSLVTVINASDHRAFRAALTDGAMMPEDGSERDVEGRSGREVLTEQT